jgi:putative transposase
MNFRKSTHCAYKTEYHIVLTPRYRRRIFVGGVKQYLETVLKNLNGLESDIEVLKANVQPDHVHMVIIIPPRLAVASVIQFMKSQSAKRIRKRFAYLNKVLYSRGGIWSTGYCVSTVGMDEKTILAYVQYQAQEDTGQLQLELGL